MRPLVVEGTPAWTIVPGPIISCRWARPASPTTCSQPLPATWSASSSAKSNAKIPSGVRRCLRTIAAGLAAHRPFALSDNLPRPLHPPHARAFALAGGGDFQEHLGPGPGADLTVKRSACRTPSAKSAFLQIFVFKYQKRRLARNWRRWSGQICDIARSEGCRACYEVVHPMSTNGSQAVRRSPFPHTPKASTKLPHGLNRKGRSFPATGLIFSGSIGWRDHPPPE